MKKLAILTVLVFSIISCGVPKTVIQSKKVIKGYWTLDNITYSEMGEFNVILLNDVSKECFEGSAWRFIPNNDTGTYTINNSNCATGDRYFIFTIQEIDPNTGLYDFLIKPTDEKKKSETNEGFRLQLIHLSDVSMQWQQVVNVDGKPFKINMNFTKINE